MKRRLFYFFLQMEFMAGFLVHAQYENVWTFGHAAGVDFNKNPPAAIRTSIVTNEGSASISDANGQLLFYTDGHSVWDRDHNMMPTGTDLAGLGRNISRSTSQGALVIPIPGNAHQYYVFTLGAIESGFPGNLYYSIVDMSLNNGMGDLLPGNKGKLLSMKNTEHMTAVSGDDCNIWLLTASSALGVFRIYKLDYKGIDTVPLVSDRIPSTYYAGGNIGTMDISTDRSKVAICQGDLVLYDFDPATGRLSSVGKLSNGSTSSYYGVAFSRDGSKLYASTAEDGLYQFNLDSNKNIFQIMASRIRLGTGGMALRRGPDGKIYCVVGSIRDQSYLSVIHSPNLAGLACQYDLFGIRLLDGTSSRSGLPNSVTTIVVNRKNYNATRDTIMCADSFLLQPQYLNGFNYKWNDGTLGSGLQIDTSGTYWVSYQATAGRCEEYVDTFHIVFYPIRRNYTTTFYKGMCRADTFTMAAKAFADDYTWEDGSKGRERRINRSGMYWVTYRIDSLCGQHADTFIAVYPDQDYQVSFVADTLACVQQPVTFQNTSNGYFSQFQWSFGDEHTATAQNPVHAYDREGVYAVTLIGKIGEICPDTVVHYITIDPLHSIRFSTDRTSICTGESIAFYPGAPFATTRLQWQFGDGTALPDQYDTVLHHAFDHAGVFPVQLTTVNRVCPTTVFTDTIRVFALPEINLGSDAGLCFHEKPLILQNLLPPPQGVYRNLWNTGDTTASLKVLHPGTYSLTIRSAPEGCSHTESVLVTKDCYLDIPNAFTPNGDGTNDYFFPRQLLSKSITQFKMQIFSRWGQLLYETTKLNGRGWDGLYQGKEQPQGIYMYSIEAAFENGSPEQYSGNVTLLR